MFIPVIILSNTPLIKLWRNGKLVFMLKSEDGSSVSIKYLDYTGPTF